MFDLLVFSDTFFRFTVCLNFSTASATLTRCEYFQGFQVSEDVRPNVAVPLAAMDLWSTSAKVEKKVALLLSSPAKNDSIFMSLGSSAKTNLTTIASPLHAIE